MNVEPELKAMNEVFVSLKDLEDEAKQRVIEWVVGRFSLSVKSTKTKGSLQEVESIDVLTNKDLTTFDSVADVFANAQVKSESEKVLLVAAYLQQKRGGELVGREINKELNHLGHGVGNITNAITSLINRKPKQMIQTRKEGKTKQAQKKYKVTTEGITTALKMISSINTKIE